MCDDARGGGPEQAQICCNLSGSSEFDNRVTNHQTISEAENGGYLKLAASLPQILFLSIPETKDTVLLINIAILHYL